MLNHPARFVPRLAFLRGLHRAGINPYRAASLDQDFSQLRYPVFVRCENDHDGPRSPLLRNRGEVEMIVKQAIDGGVSPRDLMVVEYEDVRDGDGLWRKYAYWNFGGRLMPRHLVFDSHWVVKAPTRATGRKVTVAQVAEELEFLQSRDHDEMVRRAFELARVDYGRIDYSIEDGRMVVWEVNTNPIPMTSPGQVLPERTEADRLSADRLLQEFRALDLERKTVVV